MKELTDIFTPRHYEILWRWVLCCGGRDKDIHHQQPCLAIRLMTDHSSRS